MAGQGDLLAALAPPAPDKARPLGELRGPVEGLAAGLAAWCGPVHGWRQVGELEGQGVQVVQLRRRLRLVLTFDLGPAAPLSEQAAARKSEQ